ncbi:MAG: hypothetical protein ACLQIQ_17485 [Beijerinckiaceae bacterium]
MTLLPDSPATYGEWKRLVIKRSVLGTKVHDARLVARINVHGVGRLQARSLDDWQIAIWYGKGAGELCGKTASSAIASEPADGDNSRSCLKIALAECWSQEALGRLAQLYNSFSD